MAAWSIGIALALIALDHFDQHAGLLALVVLVASLGSVHGALDVLLMARRFEQTRTRWSFAGFYLAATLITAWALWNQPAPTLLLLLALSVWHFGETFQGAPTGLQRAVLRWVRGGAPVLMPALIAPSALQTLVLAAVSGDIASSEWVWAVWRSAAVLWSGGVCMWLVSLLVWTDAEETRHTLLELAACAVLYVVTSPLMAFAIFFGLYHATGHIRRVMALVPTAAAATRRKLHRDPRVIAALAFTLMLGAGLVMALHTRTVAVFTFDGALRTLLLALTAVSVPHVVLVTCAVPVLRQELHQ